MRIALTFRLTPELERLLLGDNIIYRPDLAEKGVHATETMLESACPDVVLTRVVPSERALKLWRSQLPLTRHLCVIHIASSVDVIQPTTLSGIDFHNVPDSASSEVDAFILAEDINRQRQPAPVVAAVAQPRDRVVLIGAGVVNLITAYRLAGEGLDVEVFEAAPDPRNSQDWRKQGCTFGGEDARIFSMNEARQHHYKGLVVNASSGAQYRKCIDDDGWLYKKDAALSAADQRWIRDAERLPAWLAGRFDADIISFNRESWKLWRQMMSDSPDIFQKAGLNTQLLRLYATSAAFERAKVSEQAIGALQSELSLTDVSERYPALREAVVAGQVAGALDVAGFSVNIHRFCNALVHDLEERGVRFNWDSRAERVVRDGFGAVKGIMVKGELVVAAHYIASMGAFPDEFLEGFQSDRHISPMVGMWLTLPDEEPFLDVPLKINRQGYAARGAAEGANVISGRDASGRRVIHVSSGHGFIGSERTQICQSALGNLARAVHETAEQFFPTRYRQARAQGALTEVPRYCIRPWTSSGLGLFEVAPAKGGRFILTGGHNTGGFAQSPSVAQAVMAALRGQEHPMHSLYAPRRFHDFIGCPERVS